MPEESTTAIVQRYLGELTGEAPSEPVIRMLLDRAVLRLHRLCAILLHHDYRRLTRPPLNLHDRRATQRCGGAVAQGSALGSSEDGP